MINSQTVRQLEGIVGIGNVYTRLQERLPYRFGYVTEFRYKPPKFIADCVIKPKNTKEVAEVVKLANREKIPVTAWGGGTDFTGANSPIKGGIVLDMKSLNNVEVNTKEHYITAGGGAILLDLTNAAEKHNLLFPHELTTQPSATVGGCIATNSFGHRSGSYRSIKNLILSMEIVLPTGEIIKTKPMFRNAMGYDITTLMVGSEGTLGIITEATFRLLPQPETREFTFYLFDSLGSGFKAAEEIRGNISSEYFDLVELSLLKYSKTKVEFLKRYIKSKTVEDYLHSKYVESSLYGSIVERIIENTPMTKQLTKHLEKTMKGEGYLTIMTLGYEGPKEIVYKKVRIADNIAKKFEGLKFEDDEYYKKRFGGTLEHMQEMLIHVNESNLEKNALSTLDIGVPHNKIIEFIKAIHKLSKKYKSIQLLDIDVYSHSTALGIDFLVNLEKQKEYDMFMKEIKDKVTKFGGSLSFAHGVGIRFVKDMKTMYDQPYIEVMKKIKDSLDPNGILNPGKLGGYDEAG